MPRRSCKAGLGNLIADKTKLFGSESCPSSNRPPRRTVRLQDSPTTIASIWLLCRYSGAGVSLCFAHKCHSEAKQELSVILSVPYSTRSSMSSFTCSVALNWTQKQRTALKQSPRQQCPHRLRARLRTTEGGTDHRVAVTVP